MEIKYIKEIAKVMKDYCLVSIDITQDGESLHMERQAVAIALPAATTEPVLQGRPSLPQTSPQALQEQAIDFNDLTEVKSPMVGVFYASPSPEDKPFVAIGDRVKKGDVLCIIEAMKLMNEIVAEADGEIVDICVKNGQIVEYSQVLFKMF